MFRKTVVNLWLLAALLAALLGAQAPVAVAHDGSLTLPHNLFQFRAGGHIVGFQPERLYLAALDHALRVEFAGTAGVMPRITAGAVNSDIQRGVPPLTRVTYLNLWPGISVTYEAVSGGIAKSMYLVAPGANVSRIQLRYNAPVEVQGDGSLRFSLPSGNGYLTESPPLAWQEMAGQRVPVEAAFIVSAGNQVGFSVGGYDPRYPLAIDPTYQWHTFYGGAGSEDNGDGIAVDDSGNVYVAGWSGATWQVDSTTPLHTHSGNKDIVVVKLNSSGAYQWHTFYGSGNDDKGSDIAVDGNGDVYVTGESWQSWNGPLGQAALHAYSGPSDIFVLKLSNSGAYQWHTFYGSTNIDVGSGIAVEDSGNVYVAGWSAATWQVGSTGPLHAHSSNGTAFDIVVLTLASSGAYQWHTFYGSNDWEYGDGIAVSSGNVYVTGYGSANWQVGSTNPLHDYSGFEDIVVLKLDSSGTYQWHTFYGSSYFDEGIEIAVDGSNVYVTGFSMATWNGPTGQSPLHDYGGTGTRDIMVLKLNGSGTYQWHTFYGSGDNDVGYGIAVDGSGNVYVAGRSVMIWQGDGNADPLHGHSGILDEIVALKLNGSGAYYWHTFYGSDNADRGYGIAVDGSGNVYVTGYSVLTWQGDGNASPIHDHSVEGFPPYTDIVVMKMDGKSALTVTRAGAVSGTVTSTPAGIDCGADCSEIYNDNDGTSVTLSVAPAAGSAFTGWSGDCSGTANCVVTMTVPRTVTATFSIEVYLPIVLKNFGP